METQPTEHSTEQLEKLLEEGKISADEYESLRTAMERKVDALIFKLEAGSLTRSAFVPTT